MVNCPSSCVLLYVQFSFKGLSVSNVLELTGTWDLTIDKPYRACSRNRKKHSRQEQAINDGVYVFFFGWVDRAGVIWWVAVSTWVCNVCKHLTQQELIFPPCLSFPRAVYWFLLFMLKGWSPCSTSKQGHCFPRWTIVLDWTGFI